MAEPTIVERAGYALGDCSGRLRAARRLVAVAFAALMLACTAGCGGGSGTSLPHPAVASTVPADGATGVSLSTAISATFNQQMNLSTINFSTFVVSDPSGRVLAGSIAYDAVNFTATFTPAAPLAPNSTFTAAISAGVANIANTTLGVDFTWNFTTGTTP
jgi:hypothetical protein